MPYSIVHSPRYALDFGPHVFPTEKYAALRERLIAEHGVPPEKFLEPQMPTLEQLLTVHTPEMLRDMRELNWTPATMHSELPLTREIADGFFLFAGGSILAAREAVRHGGAGIHLGGGFHHAFADHAEGFCYLNDHAVAIRVLQREGLIKKAFVIDCDVHQGNGTAHIFQNDDSVFTVSLHQEHNYPVKQRSDLDFGLPDGIADEDYLDVLKKIFPQRLAAFEPDLLVNVAGADPYYDDQLGGLALTIDGLKQRDDLIFQSCAELEIPALVVLAGGYARNFNDTVRIQLNTCLSAIEFLGD